MKKLLLVASLVSVFAAANAMADVTASTGKLHLIASENCRAEKLCSEILLTATA